MPHGHFAPVSCERYHHLWLRRRTSTSKIQTPSWTMKTRKPSPRLMKVCAMPHRVERYQPKKSTSVCPSGLPTLLHAKIAEIIGHIAEDDPDAAMRLGRLYLTTWICFPVFPAW